MRAYLAALPDVPSDARGVARVRRCLESLQRPDLRYLVATVLGADAAPIARVAAAILRAAGARSGILGPSLGSTDLDGTPIDDAMLGRAGTLAASAGYQLAATAGDLGQLTRREASVTLSLIAFAEASERVALLPDPEIDPLSPIYAARPDLVILGTLDVSTVDRAWEAVPDGAPVVASSADEAVRSRIEDRAARTGTPLLLGGRDHRIEERGVRVALVVRDDPYVEFDPPPGIGRSELATGLAAALALGVMGIRMREEWVLAGIDSLRAEAVPS